MIVLHLESFENNLFESDFPISKKKCFYCQPFSILVMLRSNSDSDFKRLNISFKENKPNGIYPISNGFYYCVRKKGLYGFRQTDLVGPGFMRRTLLLLLLVYPKKASLLHSPEVC